MRCRLCNPAKLGNWRMYTEQINERLLQHSTYLYVQVGNKFRTVAFESLSVPNLLIWKVYQVFQLVPFETNMFHMVEGPVEVNMFVKEQASAEKTNKGWIVLVQLGTVLRHLMKTVWRVELMSKSLPYSSFVSKLAFRIKFVTKRSSCFVE